MSSQETTTTTASSQHHGPVSEAKMIERKSQPLATVDETQSGTPTSGGAVLQRQHSSSSHSGTPVQAITGYLKNLLGLSAKPTKRTLSEEAECGSPDSLREWLRQGSNPNEVDPYGYTPLVNACLRGCKKSATVLLANGADPNQKAMHGYTALHAAAQNGYFEIVELLIDHGANTEAKNDDGDTPLMLATRANYLEVVDTLCKRGCDMHAHGFENIEPIDYALSKRNLYLTDVLMKHGGQPTSPTAATTTTTTTTTTKSSSSSPSTSAAAPIMTAIPKPNPDEDDPVKQTLTENRESLTGLLLEQQEAHESKQVNKIHLERLDSEPADQEAPSTANSTNEPIFQAE